MIEPREYIFYDHRDEENRIRILQEMLRAVSRCSGDMSLSTRVDGRFDTGTENAWRAFQRKYG
ncbi:MAG: peptidoglycan-binding protein, partial [Clostridia bacterium]|nr:peptidoglycan-binding protein [Clostridia bacterium]